MNYLLWFGQLFGTETIAHVDFLHTLSNSGLFSTPWRHCWKPVHRHLQFLGDFITHMGFWVTTSPFAHEALSLSTRWILSHRRGIIKLKSIQELQRWNWNLQYISCKVFLLQKSLSPLCDDPVGKLTSSSERHNLSYNSAPFKCGNYSHLLVRAGVFNKSCENNWPDSLIFCNFREILKLQNELQEVQTWNKSKNIYTWDDLENWTRI